jgi:hypothetical protein
LPRQSHRHITSCNRVQSYDGYKWGQPRTPRKKTQQPCAVCRDLRNQPLKTATTRDRKSAALADSTNGLSGADHSRRPDRSRCYSSFLALKKPEMNGNARERRRHSMDNEALLQESSWSPPNLSSHASPSTRPRQEARHHATSTLSSSPLWEWTRCLSNVLGSPLFLKLWI